MKWLSLVHAFAGCINAKNVNVQKLQWNASLIACEEENVTMYTLVMLSVSNYFLMWLYYKVVLFWFICVNTSA